MKKFMEYSKLASITDLLVVLVQTMVVVGVIVGVIGAIMYVVAARQSGYPAFWTDWF